MNPQLQKVIAVFALSGMCVAQSATNASGGTASKKTTHRAAATKKVPVATTEDLQKLQQMMQQQIDQLKQQVAEKDQKLQQVQQQLSDAQASAQAAQQKATTVETQIADQKQKTDSSLDDVKGTLTSTIQSIQDDQKKWTETAEHPASLRYKGVTITPGGFLAAEGLWRQHTEQNDLISSFNGIPYAGSTQGHMTEFRFSGRQSRLSLLVEGKAGSAKLTGYYEMDFLGAAPTANENQSSSFNTRQRQLWGQVAFDSGWTISAGQMWSLITLNKVDASPRQEWVPATIDAQYVIGYDFARIASARVSKSFAAKKGTFAFSVENPAYLVGGIGAPANAVVVLPGTGSLGNGNNYSVNLSPDFIVKLASDTHLGHYEIKGLGRIFRDRVVPPGNTTATTTVVGNQTKVGGGVGFGGITPLVPKKLDFIFQGMYGKGVARYTDSSNVDIIVRPDGTLSPVQSGSALAGFEAHPSPRLDIYAYGGGEYLGRNQGVMVVGGTAKQFGYGNPTLNLAGCFAPEATFSCSANFKNLWHGTTGFWYRFYKGGYGTLQYGMQYEYIGKNSWTGLNGTTPVSPSTNENMVMTSFRYYIP